MRCPVPTQGTVGEVSEGGARLGLQWIQGSSGSLQIAVVIGCVFLWLAFGGRHAYPLGSYDPFEPVSSPVLQRGNCPPGTVDTRSPRGGTCTGGYANGVVAAGGLRVRDRPIP
jgi:hypothetical protein